MNNFNDELREQDAIKTHALYVSRSGQYHEEGGFTNKFNKTTSDKELWKKCREEVTGCTTLSQRVARYKV